MAHKRSGTGGRAGGKDADRAVKARAVHRPDRAAGGPGVPDFDGLHAALLVVDGDGEVTQAAGWDRVAGGRAPERLRRGASAPGRAAAGADPDAGAETEDALLDAVAAAVEESRRSRGPIRTVAEVTSDRPRYYSLSAGPARGGSGGETAVLVVEITEAFKAGPREGDSIRQLGHDLRTPLTSMGGAVELLQSGRLGELTPEQERLLGMLQQGMQMMLSLIDEATEPYRAAARAAAGGGNGSGN